MHASAARLAVPIALSFLLVGCGGHTGRGGGASFPSHSSGGSYSSHASSSSWGGSSHGSSSSGASHSSNTSYYNSHLPASARAYTPSSRSSASSSSSDSTGSQVAQAIGALAVNAVGQAISSAVSNAADAPPPPRPETDCEAALREWNEMHPDGDVKLPPQLHCGPNGEWGPSVHP